MRSRLAAPLAFGLAASIGVGGLMAKEKKSAAGFGLGKDIRSVVVTRYEKISDSRDHPDKKRVAVIRNAETVARLVGLINSLPPAGNAMIKMGDVEMIEADFHGHYDKPPVRVKLYNGWVQAPDTSFYEGLPQEKEIHGILLGARPMPQKGLRVKKPVAVRVEEYDHAIYESNGHPPNRRVEIHDAETVAQLSEWVNGLPLKGEMFVSFTGLVPITQAFFVERDGTETAVVFYIDSVSTTDGSFYGGSKTGEELQKKIRDVLVRELDRSAPAREYAFDASEARSVFIESRAAIGGPVAAWAEIDDPKVIRKVLAEIGRLPKEGDVLKSWGDETEVLTATFSRPGKPRISIEFYAGRLRTPAGTFYAPGDRSDGPLYKLLKAQLKEGNK